MKHKKAFELGKSDKEFDPDLFNKIDTNMILELNENGTTKHSFNNIKELNKSLKNSVVSNLRTSILMGNKYRGKRYIISKKIGVSSIKPIYLMMEDDSIIKIEDNKDVNFYKTIRLTHMRNCLTTTSVGYSYKKNFFYTYDKHKFVNKTHGELLEKRNGSIELYCLSSNNIVQKITSKHEFTLLTKLSSYRFVGNKLETKKIHYSGKANMFFSKSPHILKKGFKECVKNFFPYKGIDLRTNKVHHANTHRDLCNLLNVQYNSFITKKLKNIGGSYTLYEHERANKFYNKPIIKLEKIR